MKKSKNLKAFTLMEVMITMLLSCFLVMASLKIFLMFEHLILLKNQKMENSKISIQFSQTIKNDADNALSIEEYNDQILFLMPNNKYINYDIEQHYAFRALADVADTFKVEISDLKISKESITGFVNNIKMEIKIGEEIYPICISKEYTNDLLVNKVYKNHNSFKNN